MRLWQSKCNQKTVEALVRDGVLNMVVDTWPPVRIGPIDDILRLNDELSKFHRWFGRNVDLNSGRWPRIRKAAFAIFAAFLGNKVQH